MQEQQQQGPRWTTAAFTIAETLVVMLLSGILLLAVYEGIGMVKKYTDQIIERLAGGNDLLGGVESLEALFARTDSVYNNGEQYLFHGAGESVIVWQQDSLLLAEHPGGRDTLFRTVLSLRGKSPARTPEKVDSLFVTLKLSGRSVCLGFAPVVREGKVLERVREQEKTYTDELEK